MENRNRTNYQLSVIKYLLKVCLLLFFVVFLISCNEIKSPETKPFIGENAPPPKQEFRWSNGRLPKSLDPARAAAAPETDVVRALYEGLTDIDAKNFKPIPALATKWTASADLKTWKFELRRDAKWINGESVTAQNFVDSWKRLVELGDKVPQRGLLKNIVGMDSEDVLPVFAEEPNEESETVEPNKFLQQNVQIESNSNAGKQPTPAPTSTVKNENHSKVPPKSPAKFGIEAVNDFTLKISLVHPDQDFPLLVAHPLFRPVFGDGKEFEDNGLNPEIVTNGAFKIAAIGKDGITLERSTVYWNKYAVKLETVKFVPTENAESALAAYREGKVDAVTNANFQPLALKLLRPFANEFHQTTHGALNFYEFNLQQKPFDDARVRKALAISIEREHLTEDEMDGATEPALSFLPFEEERSKLVQSVEKARKFLAEAGFPNGENFPTVKLVVNRNNMQQRIARSVARMWLKNLNVKTEIVTKDQADIQNLVQTGDFSLVRRGVVLPTNNETSNMLAMFDETKRLPVKEEEKEIPKEKEENESVNSNQILTEKSAESELNLAESSPETIEKPVEQETAPFQTQTILTGDQALEQLPAIPLYFPTSYSLVKPYIQGFELNAFDATSLKNVEIDSNWQPTGDKINSNK